jgi:hypothetical protein
MRALCEPLPQLGGVPWLGLLALRRAAGVATFSPDMEAGAGARDRRGARAAMVHRAALIPLLLLALGGCASGPADSAPEPIPAGMAQLVVTRSSDWNYMAVKAVVDVNGTRMAELSRDDGYSTTVRPGRTTLSAAGVSNPGRYSISFNAEAGKIYRFEVSPRPEGYIAPAGRAAIIYATNENAGVFKIEPEN